MRYLVLCLLLVGTAHADRGGKKAARHFAAAERAEKRKDYATAIREYKKAYKVKPHASVLYNIAVDYEALSDWGQAAEYYRRYLDETVDPADHAQVEAELDVLQAKVGRAILEDAAKAKGGLDALRGIEDISYRFSVRFDSGGSPFYTDLRSLRSRDSVRNEVTKDNMKDLQIITPDGGWTQDPSGKVVEMDPDRLVRVHDDLWREPELLLATALDPATIVRALGKETAFDKEYDAVEVSRADGTARTKLLIDPVTHLLFRLAFDSDATQVSVDYSDYTKVSGIVFAQRQVLKKADLKITLTAKEIVVNAGLPEGTFARP